MNKDATNFIRNRKVVVSITYNRIVHIVNYVIDCYLLLANSSVQYSKSEISRTSTISPEDYLKMNLVDRYLIPNKELIIAQCKDLETINFHYEPQKRYVDVTDNKEKPDKIDIYINRLGLQDKWNEEDEHIYFAIECKRMSKLSDCATYLTDTQKFVNRDYDKLRLPFEGQLAFVENSKLTPILISEELNKRLTNISTITTTKPLDIENLKYSKHSCYTSLHKRNYKRKDNFKIFHLFFDYSKILVS